MKLDGMTSANSLVAVVAVVVVSFCLRIVFYGTNLITSGDRWIGTASPRKLILIAAPGLA